MKNFNIKRLMIITLAVILILTTTSCGEDNKEIYIVTREEGSGTRSAFVDLAGVKDQEGRDLITQRAEVTNSTAVMLQTIAGNKNAIGYVSLGSLSDNVKTTAVDGATINASNIKKGKYKIARPFNVVVGQQVSPLAEDFISFLLSQEGQKIVESQGYISQIAKDAYTEKEGLAGKITIAGSTSVAPVVEIIGEEYMNMYPQVKIEVQQSGSSAGVIAVKEGVSDIGLTSREVTKEELDGNMQVVKIAMDGIAIIVNKENSVENLSSNQVKEIFSGATGFWKEQVSHE